MEHHTAHVLSEHDEDAAHPKWAKYRFIVLITTSIVIALTLVSISMSLYSSSGTAQLDLSRPGYKSVRDQVQPESDYSTFSASGPINATELNKFQSLYDARLKDATSVEVFTSDVLSDEALSIDDATAVPPQ